MKFLIDENLPPRLAGWLNARGHDAIHVRDCGLLGAADSALAELASREGRVIVTQDADFERPRPGVRALRLGLGNASASALIAWLAPRLEKALAQFASGATAVTLES